MTIYKIGNVLACTLNFTILFKRRTGTIVLVYEIESRTETISGISFLKPFLQVEVVQWSTLAFANLCAGVSYLAPRL